MDDANAPERVEIELTPHEAPSVWARPRAGAEPQVAHSEAADTGLEADGPPAATWAEGRRAYGESGHRAVAASQREEVVRSDPSPEFPEAWEPAARSRLSIERGRLLGLAAALAVLALLIGWAIGRSGTEPTAVDATDTSPSSQGVPTTTSLAPESTVAGIDDAILSAAPASTDPESTVPRRTTTTVPEQWQLTTVEIDPRAAELDIEIVAVTPNRIVEYDTGNGESASFEFRSNTDSGPPKVEAGSDWIRVDSGDPSMSPSKLFEGRDPPVTLDSIGGWNPFYRQAASDRFWRLETDSIGYSSGVVETDRTGSETGVAFDVPRQAWVMGADPAGGVIVNAPGGTYQMAVDGSWRITTGSLIALGAQRALIGDCGDDMTTCGLLVQDRATGATTPVTPVLPESAPQDAAYSYEVAWGNSAFPSISPDGRYAPLTIFTEQFRSFGVIDLTNGEFIELAENPESNLWWTPDSRGLVFVMSGSLYLHDFDTGESIRIVPDAIGITSFAVRT